MAKRKKKPADQWTEQTARDWVKPTPELRGKGDFVLIEGDKEGGRRAFNRKVCPVEDCWTRGNITESQYLAAERYEQLCRSMMIPGPRSCLDWMPRGESEEAGEYAVRRCRSYKELREMLGTKRLNVLIDICINQEPTGRRDEKYPRWRNFRGGLDVCAQYFGV